MREISPPLFLALSHVCHPEGVHLEEELEKELAGLLLENVGKWIAKGKHGPTERDTEPGAGKRIRLSVGGGSGQGGYGGP
jgi:hypothetical protein